MFSVQRDGREVQYFGKLIKRTTPKAEDYLILGPGKSIEADIDLAKLYDFGKTGRYTIRFRLNPTAIPETDGPLKSFILSNILEDLVTAPRPVSRKSKLPAYSGCTVTEQYILESALAASQEIARIARQDLADTPVDKRALAERYLEWFGEYEPSRYDTVQEHFNKIDDALSNQQITFVCDCTENYFAYVYPSIPYEIHPCNVFWEVEVTGTDSQAGTIVHETSHFTVVAGTNDFIYGQNGCRRLADNLPNLAINNADSHEYFAENTPFLDMPTGSSTIDVPNIVPTIFLLLDDNKWKTSGKQHKQK
ncbi:M35 family metallo-endopeptidase [Desulfolithobacter sp.]